MEKLLHWSIANSQNDSEAIAKAGQPDPELLKQLFGGGVDEPTLMKHAMAAIVNPETDLENKLTALDNFEMLIENLDNANNIENLKLWEPLLSALGDKEPEVRTFVLSIIGTAVQNNEKSQGNFIKYPGGLESVLKLAGDESEELQVRTKAFYTLSNLVRHNTEILNEFDRLNGLSIIAPVLQDENGDEKLKLRAMALLTAVLTATQLNEDFFETLRVDHIVQCTLNFLNPSCNIYLIDRALNFLSQLIEAGIQFLPVELEKLKAGMEQIVEVEDRLNEDDYRTVKYVSK